MFSASVVYVDASLVTTTSSYSIANRNGSGTDGMGYKTINEAISGVSDGGTIYIRAGTYSERGQADICYPINKSVTIKAYNNETVTMTYPVGNPPLVSPGEYGYIIKTLKSVTLEGLTIIGTHDEGDNPVGDTDVSLLIVTEGVTVRKCKFQKFGHCAIKLSTTTTPVIIEQNIFEAGGFTGRDHHIYSTNGPATGRNIIRHNVFTGAAGYTVHLYDRMPANHDIYGNIMFANGLDTNNPANGGGILLGGSGHRVYNNTIVTGQNRAGLTFWKQESDGHIVKNNIIRDCAAYDVVMDDSGVFTSAYNNVHTTNGMGWDNTGGMDVDPLLVSATPAAFADCRLQAESPMIGAGELLESPYNQVLDASITTWPTPKTIISPVIGGFS